MMCIQEILEIIACTTYSTKLTIFYIICLHTVFNSYMRQVLDETQRLSLLTPITGREQGEDIELGGYIIPKNVSLELKYVT